MACLLNLLVFGSFIHVASTKTDTLKCTFDSNESDCFLKQVVNSSTGSFSISSGPTAQKGTGQDGPYEGDQFLSYSADSTNISAKVYDSMVPKETIWTARDYCLKLAFHQLVTHTVDRIEFMFGVLRKQKFYLLSRGNKGNKWISWATDLDSSSIPSLKLIFLPGKSVIGLDSVQLVAKKCGCLKNPCKNGGTCSEDINGKVQCKCPKGIYGDTCEILGEGSMTCNFEAKEYFIDDCFFKGFSAGISFGKGDTPAKGTGKDSKHYIYVDTMDPLTKLRKKATLLFNKFNGNCKTYRLSMDAFMHGKNVGTLKIVVSSKTIIKLKGDQGQSWKPLKKEIKYAEGMDIKIQYEFPNPTDGVLGLDNLGLTCIDK